MARARGTTAIRAICPALALVIQFSAPVSPAVASDLAERAEAEAIVRATYYEGMPFEAPLGLGSAGVERLAEMLRDPSEEEHRSKIVMALGLSHHPDAFAPLQSYAKRRPRGRISRDEMHARLALPVALGHLSRSDPRAYQLLVKRLRARDPVGWHDERFGSDRLREMLHRTRIQAVGVSGKQEGVQLLSGMLANTDDPRRREIMHEALDLSDRVHAVGAARVFGGKDR